MISRSKRQLLPCCKLLNSRPKFFKTQSSLFREFYITFKLLRELN